MAKKTGEKRRISALSLVVISIIILILIGLIIYIFFQLKNGNFVYNKETGMIGEVEGVSFPMHYIIHWQDDSYSRESLLNARKLNKLSEEDAIRILKRTGTSLYAYFDEYKSERAEIVSEELNESNISVYATYGTLPCFTVKDNFVSLIGEENCKPDYICSEWSNCKTTYELVSIIEEKAADGFQYRYCKDYTKCLSDFIDSRRCKVKVSVSANKIIINGKEYIEVYDENKTLISRLELTNETNKKLNIQLLFDEKSYRPYCFDGIRNYNEDEIDCLYEGEDCPLCSKAEVSSFKANYILRILILVFLILAFLELVWMYYILKEKHRYTLKKKYI